MNQSKLFNARDIYMPRLRQLRDELRQTERDNNRKREALFKDPEWLKYLEMNAEAGYLIKQESKLMSPAPFAPVKR